jgi:hypothetical protein
LSERLNFRIGIGDAYVSYNLSVDEKNFRTAFKRFSTFILKNDSQMHRLAMEINKSHQKNKVRIEQNRPVRCRVPVWFNKVSLNVPDAIALVLYFAHKPLTTGQITQVMNLHFGKIDLRNISKHLTSRTSDLYGFTLYDDNTSTYELSNFGKNWVEKELLDTIKKSPKMKQKAIRKETHTGVQKVSQL